MESSIHLPPSRAFPGPYRAFFFFFFLPSLKPVSYPYAKQQKQDSLLQRCLLALTVEQNSAK